VLDLLGGGVDLLLALLGTTTEAEHQVEGRLLLDVVVRKSAAILKLLTSKDQTLLIRGDSLLILCSHRQLMFGRRRRIGFARERTDLRLDIVNGVGGLDLKGNGLAREGLDENLHLRRSTSSSANDASVPGRVVSHFILRASYLLSLIIIWAIRTFDDG
jgi:hypothetical protein